MNECQYTEVVGHILSSDNSRVSPTNPRHILTLAAEMVSRLPGVLVAAMRVSLTVRGDQVSRSANEGTRPAIQGYKVHDNRYSDRNRDTETQRDRDTEADLIMSVEQNN